MRDMDPSKIGIIEIVEIPEGTAPLRIRREWVGLQMPALYREDANDHTVGVITGQPMLAYDAYMVLQCHAIELLAEVSPEAAAFWSSMGYPRHELALFGFDVECAEVRNPVPTRTEFETLCKACLLDS